MRPYRPRRVGHQVDSERNDCCDGVPARVNFDLYLPLSAESLLEALILEKIFYVVEVDVFTPRLFVLLGGVLVALRRGGGRGRRHDDLSKVTSTVRV